MENKTLTPKEFPGDLFRIGFVSIIFGLIVFLLGTPLRLDWFVQNKYIYNAPAIILFSFLAIGIILIFVSWRGSRVKN
jgi:hypothetical protein